MQPFEVYFITRMTYGNDTHLTMNAGYEIDAETELDAKYKATELRSNQAESPRSLVVG